MEHRFEIGEDNFLLDGNKLVIRCGEMHFARVPQEYWRHRLKMAKAMGLNTVCAYMFWNFHEWEEGKFDWSGWRDVAGFCRMAQEEGLWVIVRPGPYACAEWEMGGLPWWLLKRDGLKVRSRDPRFMEPATRYLREVAGQLRELQVSKGGPILMMQVENEYGFFGNDAQYMGELRQVFIDAGIEVPLFACNPIHALGSGYREDLFQVVNFSPGAAEGGFKELRKFQKTGPLMNGEFYPAWFDVWGRGHRTTNIGNFIGDLRYMLENDNSFSIYMAHGGTSFGLWAGADRPFSPDTSSYDYDAPISEAGWATSDFGEIRELFRKHLLPGETMPEAPAANPVIEIAPFTLNESAAVFENLPAPIREETPKYFEAYDLSRGSMVYRTTVPAGPAATLKAKRVNDFGWVFLDGKQVGVLDRRSTRYSLRLPAREKEARLDILVHTMGRINFGGEVFDRKGLHAPITLDDEDLRGWELFPLAIEDGYQAGLKFKPGAAKGPAFWRGSFQVERPGDTFLDTRSWGKGVVWLNGRCLGRFWNIGPQQTTYVPGVWLKPGRNEVVVYDLLGPEKAELAGLAKPILDQVRLEKDFARIARATGEFSAEGTSVAAEGEFSRDTASQDVRFAQPLKGRYLCFEATSSQNSAPFAAVAELDGLGQDGKVVSKDLWSVFWVSSEEINAESGHAENAIDGQASSHWHSAYSAQKAGYPHRLVIDLGEERELAGLRYLPRTGKEENGRVKGYRVYFSAEPYGLRAAE
jgi:beta-galactosidase